MAGKFPESLGPEDLPSGEPDNFYESIVNPDGYDRTRRRNWRKYTNPKLWFLLPEEEQKQMAEALSAFEEAAAEAELTEEEWMERFQERADFEREVERDIDSLPETEE